MSHPLDAPRLKLVRARTHLDTLRTEIDTFLETGAFTAVPEIAPHSEFYAFRINLRGAPPDLARLLIGDCLHNLRSSLDYLAWQLALLNTQDPGDQTAFPITSEASKFSESRKRRLHHISPEARDLIEQMQPYQGERQSVLWILRELDDTEKHRTIPLCAAIPKGIALGGISMTIDLGLIPLRIIEDGELFRGIMVGTPNAPFRFNLAFAGPSSAKGLPVTGTLETIHSVISQDILPAFEQFFS